MRFGFSAALLAAALLIPSLEAATPVAGEPVGRLSLETRLTPQVPSTSAPLQTMQPSKGSSTLGTYFAALLALAGGGMYFVKRGGIRFGGNKAGENRLQLLETKMLGNRQFLVVVQYDDSKMLVGVGPGQIQYLCPLESADADMERLIARTQLAGGEVA